MKCYVYWTENNMSETEWSQRIYLKWMLKLILAVDIFE